MGNKEKIREIEQLAIDLSVRAHDVQGVRIVASVGDPDGLSAKQPKKKEIAAFCSGVSITAAMFVAALEHGICGYTAEEVLGRAISMWICEREG